VNSTTGSISVSDASGSCAITASKAGDNNYNGPVSDGPKTVTLNKATQDALVLTVPSSVTYGATGTASTTGGSGTGARTFSAGTSTGCSVDASTGAISVTNATGTCSISASKAGDNNYNGPAADGPKSVTLNKADQVSLALSVPGSVTFGTTGTATTTGGSGTGAVTFSAGASTGCSIDGSSGVISVSNASGTCSISASKAGDNNYNGPASDGPKAVPLNKANQSAVSVTGPGSVTFGTTGTAAASGGEGGGAYSFSAGTSNGCSVSGTTVSVTNASGTCALTATRAGDNNYNASAVSAPFTVTLNKANQQAVTVTAPGSVTYGSTGTAVATGGDGTGAYSFDAGTSSGCSVTGTTVSVSNASGTCALTATRAGDNNYNASTPSASFTVTLKKANQIAAVVVTAPATVTYGTTGTASASGGEGTGGYVFTATGTGCAVSGATVSVSDASGTCALTAIRAADNNYNASASSASFPVTLTKATQPALELTVPASVTFGATGTASTTGGAGTGSLTFSAGASTGCSVDASSGVISVSNASGTCSISASKAGDNNYLGPVGDGPKSVTLNKATQMALVLTVPASVTYGATGTASTTGGSGAGVVTFSAAGSTGCAVNAGNGVISVSDASGICSISASKAGDNNYNGPVSDGPKSVVLNKANQSAVTVTAPGAVTFGATGTALASGGDGTGAYSFSAGTSTGCSVLGTTVSVSNASGTCALTATKAGDNNYNASAASASFTVTLNKANQSAVTVTAPSAITYGTTGTAAATGGDGTGGYSFDAGTSGGCSVTGTTVSVTNASKTCALTATRAGDNNYNASATSAPFTVTLSKANQTTPVVVTAPNSVTYGTTGTAAATGGNGTGAYSFSTGASTGCSVSGTTVSVSNASQSCALTATRGSDDNYNASGLSAAFPVTLNRADQTISWADPAAIIYGTNLAGVLNATVTVGDGALTYKEGAASLATTTILNAGSHVLTVTAAQTSNYNSATKNVTLTVNPAAATVVLSNLVQPANNVQSPTATATPVGSTTPVAVGFTFTYTVNGLQTQTKPTQVGVYPLSVDIVSGANYTGHSDGYFVIYDPAGGFVTGGGWIVADAGSCVQANAPTGVCTNATGGRANFGFVSKYEKGANVPTGNTEFQFQAGNLNFKSTVYQWLVVSGARAQYKGSGTLNGQAGYDFILTAIDGSLPGGNNQDRFRIKITYNGNVVFDNQITASDTDGLAGTSTALSGGSINIKSK
jgi:hypothetical protein